MRLKGKTAIVTGGASGFGEGIVRKFLDEGARVVIADINIDAANRLADEVGKDAIAVYVDVTSGASVELLRTDIKKSFDRIDIVINNAGVTHLPAALDEVSEEDFDRVFAVNCKSVYLMARTFIPDMKARKAGVILNIASTAGVSPRPNLNWYNSSKGWMNTATKRWRSSLRPLVFE